MAEHYSQKITRKTFVTLFMTHLFVLEEDLEKMKLNEPGRQELEKAEILADGGL